MYLVGFTIEIYYDARTYKPQKKKGSRLGDFFWGGGGGTSRNLCTCHPKITEILVFVYLALLFGTYAMEQSPS